MSILPFKEGSFAYMGVLVNCSATTRLRRMDNLASSTATIESGTFTYSIAGSKGNRLSIYIRAWREEYVWELGLIAGIARGFQDILHLNDNAMMNETLNIYLLRLSHETPSSVAARLTCSRWTRQVFTVTWFVRSHKDLLLGFELKEVFS